MRIIRPIVITPAMLTSSTIVEDDYTAWDNGTAYVVGNKCVYEHKIYECLVNNTNNIPTSYLTTTPPKWLDLGYTNQWKMFDNVVGTQSIDADKIVVELTPGVFDSISFLDVEASSISISMDDPVEGVVFTETIDMVLGGHTNNWYRYFFDPIITQDSAVLLGVPPYANATTTVTISNEGGTAKIGTLIVGAQTELGLTQYEPNISITDYSKKEVDAFGNYVIVERRFSKKLSCEIILNSSEVDSLQKILASYRATPLVWVGSDASYSSMIIYGFYKSFQITVPYRIKSLCTLEIEGLA